MSYNLKSENFRYKHAITKCGSFTAQALFKEHYHTEYEVLYFIKGKGKLFIEQHCYHLLPGHLIIIKPGNYHYLDINTDYDYERVVLRFGENILSPYVATTLNNAETIYNIAGYHLANIIAQLDLYYEILPQKTIMEVFYHHLQIILLLLSTFPKKTVPESTLQDNDLLRVIDFINENLVSITKLEDVSQGVDMSLAKIQRIMQKHLNTSLMAYIRTKKIMKANIFLQEGLPASKVYSLCGFSDYTTFYRNYVRVIGHAPIMRS